MNTLLADDINTQQQETLTAAFEFFNETSEQLSSSYRVLEKRVEQLTLELDKVAQEKEKEHEKKQKIAEQMRALLNFLPGGVIVLDAKGYILEANPAARELLTNALEGKLWREVIQLCFAPKNDDGLEVSTRNGRRISIATSSLGNDGQIILLTDQTDTRKLQESLSHHEKLSAMGKMVSTLAHQIRTPLSAAMLYAGHLCNDTICNEKRDQFSHKLYGRLQHMEKQVRDMMLFVKSELPLNDVVSLADLELGLREAAEVALSTSNSRCQWHNQYPTKQVKCHREALISALMNLVNNSIQASGQSPKILIEMSCISNGKNETAVIKVVDWGQGMAADILDNAQEIFVTTKAQGTGLGLSVVQSVMRAHGGTFRLLSQAGQGTEALIEIPVLTNTPLTM
ncbi:sensor histidine kinase [Agarilytica rhodophyticola]|uniref:sensor histidine kinase n=1 Tax=Agarilytica rhodophyticola TaxID=1737490 RepID=UPI000B343916|nr:ATP-binding protein [Agarilytica rhodophyticola]